MIYRELFSVKADELINPSTWRRYITSRNRRNFTLFIMAKSLRSKWKRKMKAEKRKRYAVKELVQLKKALATKDDHSTLVSWVNIKKKCKKPPSSPKPLPEKRKSLKEASALNDKEAVMEVDETVKVFDKNLRDQNGNLPIWLHPRKVKKLKASGKKKGKGKKKGGATW